MRYSKFNRHEIIWIFAIWVEYHVAAKLGDILVPTIYQAEGAFTVSLSVGNEISVIIELLIFRR